MQKMLSRAIVGLVSAVLLVGCGGGGDDDEVEKPLFSLWTADWNGAAYDFRSMQFGPDNVFYLFNTNGTKCICDAAVIGDDFRGTFALTGCTASPPAANDQCPAANGTSNYTNRNGVLSFTRNGVTSTLR